MFVVKHGAEGMVQCLEGVQPGMTGMIVNQVWVTALEAAPPEVSLGRLAGYGRQHRDGSTGMASHHIIDHHLARPPSVMTPRCASWVWFGC